VLIQALLKTLQQKPASATPVRGKINERHTLDKSEILTDPIVRRFLRSIAETKHKSLLAVTKVVKILHIRFFTGSLKPVSIESNAPSPHPGCAELSGPV
jgi:hypothetical protein